MHYMYIAKLAIYYMHVPYPSLWLPVPGLSSQFFAIISYILEISND